MSSNTLNKQGALIEDEALISLVQQAEEDITNGCTMTSEEFKDRLSGKRKPSPMLEKALEEAANISKPLNVLDEKTSLEVLEAANVKVEGYFNPTKERLDEITNYLDILVSEEDFDYGFQEYKE